MMYRLELLNQYSIRTDYQKYPKFFSEAKQQTILRCGYCDSETVETKTPSGTTLYYCRDKFCNFYGKIVSH